MFHMEHGGQAAMSGWDALGSEMTIDYIFPELCAYYRANGRMFEGLSSLVQEKLSARLSKITRSLTKWMEHSSENWRDVVKRSVKDSQVQSVLLERKLLKEVFVAP